MWLYTVMKIIGIIPFNLAFLFRVRYLCAKNMPKEGPVIVCCNHISVMDPLFLICMFGRKIRFMGKAEAFKGKFANWFLRNSGVFPVKRGTADIEAVKTSIRILKSGGVLGIFPEGHRQVHGAERDTAKAGIAMFAAKTKATVLPVAISAKKGKVSFFKKVVVKCGEPITFEQLGFREFNNEEYQRVSEQIMDKIYSIKSEIDF